MDKLFNVKKETISAIFIIAFVSLFILANFAAGFVLPLFVLAMAVAGAIAFFYPRSGVAAIVFLTFIFERFFTLQPIVWGRAEYKLYPLDIILIAVLANIIFNLIYSYYKLRSQSIITTDIMNNYHSERSEESRNSLTTALNNRIPRYARNDIRLKGADFFLIAFIILATVYFFINAFVLKTDFALSFSSFKHYAFYPLLYFAVVYLFNDEKKNIWLFKFALAGAIGIIFFIFYGLITGSGLWSEFTPLSTEGIRTLAFPHAFYLSLAIIGLTTYLTSSDSISSKKSDITKSTGRWKMLYGNFYWILMLIWTIGIIGSMMRHLWIGLFVSIAALFLILPKEKRNNLKKNIAGGAALAIAVIIFVVYLSLLFPTSGFKGITSYTGDVIGSRIGSLASVSGDESFSWRGVVWKEAVKEYLKSPILGIGFGKKIYIEIEKYKDFIEVRNIHNSPLVILVQMGIITFLLFASLVLINIKNIYKKTDKTWVDFLLLALAANYLMAFLFQPYLEANHMAIWLWMILGFMRIYSNKNYLNQNEKNV